MKESTRNSFSLAAATEKVRGLFELLKKTLGGIPTIPIHYDCDPGQDDVIALMYALGSGKIDVRSISIVGGNADVQQCARNAQQILDLCGYSNIPVHVGAPQPLKRILHSLPEVFGESGMDGAEDLPPPSKLPVSQDAVGFLAHKPDFPDIAHLSIDPVPKNWMPRTWVATGPLTNVALALQKDPSLKDRIAGFDTVVLRTSSLNLKQIAAVTKSGGRAIAGVFQDVQQARQDGTIKTDRRGFYVFDKQNDNWSGRTLERVLIARPGGNETAFVYDHVPREEQGEVSKLIQAQSPIVEQVMFVEVLPDGSLHGQMAGGEFCGNATRSFGY